VSHTAGNPVACLADPLAQVAAPAPNARSELFAPEGFPQQ
jgi:hypothetical protein